jgi:arginyl-tRNA synthetase
VLSDFEKKLIQAGEEYSPSVLAQYLFELAKEYNRFYAELPIFNESNPKIQSLRIALSAMTAKTIRRGMQLLGIKVPDRM